jgi:hypothetical protein
MSVLKTRVGYDVLAHAIRGLLSNVETADETLGSLLSLGLENFSISGVIASLRSIDPSDLESTLTAFEPQFRFIRHPGAIKLLWDVAFDQCASDLQSRLLFVKLFDHIARACHRNMAALCTIGLVGSLFDSILGNTDDMPDAEGLRRAQQELLKRLLEVGTSTAEARNIFRKVITEGGALQSTVLEIIRTGMKARWPIHFSFESQAALVLAQEGLRGMPTTGFTFMVSILVPVKIICQLIWDSRGYGSTKCQQMFHTSFLAFGLGLFCVSRCAYVPMVELNFKPQEVANQFSLVRR